MFNGESGIEFDNETGELLFNHGGCRPLTALQAGGQFHGWWGTEFMDIAPSDRRLKEHIQPVFQTLQQKRSHLLGASGGGLEGGSQMIEDIFQKLRPVSYNFRPEAGAERFGFIADELHKVLPEMTRVAKNKDRTMGILYQDLLAVLLVRMQDMFGELGSLTGRLLTVESRTAQRKAYKKRRAWVARQRLR